MVLWRCAAVWPSRGSQAQRPRPQYPRRDLVLSPHHSLFVDGFLIPVQWLVNGSTITFADTDNCEAIEYFHIEMENHEVVFAEGTPAETLLVEYGRE
jgi:Hint domain-containing protein